MPFVRNNYTGRSLFFKMFLTGVVLFCCFFTAGAQKLRSQDFRPVAGTWKGQLTYLDYSSNKKKVIPAEAVIALTGKRQFDISLSYPEEPAMNTKDVYVIDKRGAGINEKKLVEYVKLPGGSLKIVLESTGTDGNDNQPAVFRQEMIISDTVFSITKQVKREKDTTFFQRNQYYFTR